MRVIRTSGSVRGEDGDILAYSAGDFRERRRAGSWIGFIKAGKARIAIGVQKAATVFQQNMSVAGFAIG